MPHCKNKKRHEQKTNLFVPVQLLIHYLSRSVLLELYVLCLKLAKIRPTIKCFLKSVSLL
jgi:hypothetical protein